MENFQFNKNFKMLEEDKDIPPKEKQSIQKILDENSLYYDWQLMELTLEDLKKIFNLGQATLIWKIIQSKKVNHSNFQISY